MQHADGLTNTTSPVCAQFFQL